MAATSVGRQRYCSEQNLKHLESAAVPEKKIKAYIATKKDKHEERPSAAKRGPLPRGATRVERMKRKLQTLAGAKVYAQRKGIVEPVFGQIQQGRGMRGFLLRGLEKVRGEGALIGLTHNILKMHTLCHG